MSRSLGVTVIAILVLIGSVLTLLMGLLMGLVMVFAPAPSQADMPAPQIFLKVIMGFATLMYIIPAIWGIFSGIGLWRLRNWARISTIVFAVLLIAFAGFGGLIFVSLPIPSGTNGLDPDAAHVMRLIMCGFALTMSGIGVWWLVLLTRPKIRAQFVPLPLATDPLQTLSVPAAITSGPPKPPLSLIILAWYLLSVCLFLPFALLMRAPVMFLLQVFTGWSAIAYYIVIVALHIYMGVGLLRLKPAAWMVTVAYFVVFMINGALLFFSSAGRDRLLAMIEDQRHTMFPWLPQWQNQFDPHFNFRPFLVIGGIVNVTLTAGLIYLLISRKAAFDAAAEARHQ